MSLNRNKIIEHFLGHLSNVVAHAIINIPPLSPELKEKYSKEIANSLEKALKYRELINPKDKSLSEYDIQYIKEKIKRRVKAELESRIARGYENIPNDNIDEEIDKLLKKLNIF